ncbi:restriction endonuclease [Micromonospora aurantiaca (nom. illeg.)]|uniref:restriction endonuclease n=1 Tax=Micromonospora aurantiaca (nom. illeg.) TaxID=47850 RepID=UPI0037FC8EFB
MVSRSLAAIDPNARIRHNVKVPGRLSRIKRQIDVWAIGRIAGMDMTVAVECKRLGRAVNVERVDQFIGKLLDIGADRGMLYSCSGFTPGARNRASCARNPAVLAVETEESESIGGIWNMTEVPVELFTPSRPRLNSCRPAPLIDTKLLETWLTTQEWPN